MMLTKDCDSDKARVREAIAKAQARCGGSEASLARSTGYSQNAIWAANKKGRMTLEMAVRIERATNGEVPCWESRPDVFSPPFSEHSSVAFDSTAGRTAPASPDPIPETEPALEQDGSPARAADLRHSHSSAPSGAKVSGRRRRILPTATTSPADHT
ncbi:transcriptional regulator [Bradyrhizobium oligotrophicum]|uniref:transcriptional regulator n=1 Tax=Bradyrhizobium oligotrophicum TaxID=44255 RepID=UPI003EB775D7